MLFATILSLCTVVQQCLTSPVYTMQPAFITANIGTSGRNIRHLPCVSRKSGLTGTCMFAIDCLKANGTHLGTCIDRFYFGSCCHIEPNDINENVINDSALLPDRHPPHRYSTTTTSSTEKSSITDSTQMSSTTSSGKLSSSTKSISSTDTSTSSPKTTITSTLKPSVITTTPSTTTTQKLTTKKPLTSIFTRTTTLKPTTKQLPKVTTIKPTVQPQKLTSVFKISSSTDSYKLSTFQSVDSSDTTTVRPVKPSKPTQKPTKPSTTIFKPSSTKPRPRPTTVKPVVNTTRPNLIRPTVQQKPSTRVTVKPTRSTTAKPSTKVTIKATKPPQTQSSIGTSTSFTKTTVKPVKLTTNLQRTTTSKPITTSQKTTSSKLTSESRITSPSELPTSAITTPSTTKLTTTKIRSTTTIPLIRPVRPSTTAPSTITQSQTTTTIKPVITTTSPPATTSAKSTTEATTPEITKKSTLSTSTTPTIPTPNIISNELEATSKLPALEAVNGNIATNEIEPQKKPEGVSSEKPLSFTTQGPSLITWAMVNNEQTTKEPLNNTEAEVDEEWTPITPPDGWVLLPSVSTQQNVSEPTTEPVSPEPSSSESPATLSSTESPIPSSSEFSSTTTLGSFVTFTMAAESTTVSFSPSISTLSEEATEENITQTERVPSPVTSTITDLLNHTMVTMELVNLVNGSGATVAAATQHTTPSMITPPMEDSTQSSLNMSDFTDVCGRRMFPEPRIVGGEKSSFGKWPWQISLRQWKSTTYLHKCGAALLNENWAITAAHCVDNVPPSDLLLRLGEHDLSTDAEPYIHQERRVQIVASHPQFDPRTFEYDLALLRFYEPVQFQPNIIPVCVPLNDETFVGRSAFVTGWGRLYEDGPLPSILQEVSVPVINNTVCEAMYRNAGYIEHIPNIFICAGWKQGGFDSCEGDSGGPMVIQRPDKRFLLAGIISWGIGCAEPNQPGVYTRISEFRDWINQILQF